MKLDTLKEKAKEIKEQEIKTMSGKHNMILKTVQTHIIKNEEKKGHLSKSRENGNGLSFTDLLEFMRQNAQE